MLVTVRSYEIEGPRLSAGATHKLKPSPSTWPESWNIYIPLGSTSYIPDPVLDPCVDQFLTPMVEFTINSSINATTGYAPFELNYGYMPQSGQHISTNTTFKGVKQFTQQAVWNLMDAHNAILEHRIGQTHYSNKHCQPGIKYQINDLVYLLTKNLTLLKHRA